MPTYYKALDAKGRSCYGGSLKWSLPRWNATAQTWTPGKWMPKIAGEIEACEQRLPRRQGYNAAPRLAPRPHLHHRIAVRVDRRGQQSRHRWPVRLIAGTAWNDQAARLFAVACALECPSAVRESLPRRSPRERCARHRVALCLWRCHPRRTLRRTGRRMGRRRAAAGPPQGRRRGRRMGRRRGRRTKQPSYSPRPIPHRRPRLVATTTSHHGVPPMPILLLALALAFLFDAYHALKGAPRC